MQTRQGDAHAAAIKLYARLRSNVVFSAYSYNCWLGSGAVGHSWTWPTRECGPQ